MVMCSGKRGFMSRGRHWYSDVQWKVSVHVMREAFGMIMFSERGCSCHEEDIDMVMCCGNRVFMSGGRHLNFALMVIGGKVG